MHRSLGAGLIVAVTTLILALPTKADTITNIDLSTFYNGDWSTATNGAAMVVGAESGSGNAGTGLTFSDPTGHYVGMSWDGSAFPISTTISSLAIALTSSSTINGLFNNFFGSTNKEGTVSVTNSNGDTVTFSLIGGETIRDHNNDGFVNTISGSNSNPAVDGDVTAQLWWFTDTGGTDPSSPGSPSSRLDAQTFQLPASWDGTNLSSITITDTDTINADLILTALQVDAATPTTGVPEPSSCALLGTALAGIGVIRRRRRAGRGRRSTLATV